jgi:type I restriction enzyme S subunit
MIEGLKPYAKYKESGLPWLGRYPSHWVIKRGKSYMTCVDQRSKSGKEELLTVSSARGVIPRHTAKVTMFKAASYSGYKLCWPGDLVINSLWAWGGGLGVTQHHGIISTAYSVYRPRPSAHMNPRFLHELVRSSSFNWELHVRSKGIWISRLQLTDTSFLDAPIPLPPPEEQAAIVRFLDHANRKIDGFIRAKRKLIGLLNEQKQAIIHRAVTRGLHPDVPLKPSGIPWLGDIPMHWDTPLLGRCLTRVEQGWSPVGAEGELGERQWCVLTLSAVRRGIFNPEAIKPVSTSADIPRDIEVANGDLLLTRSNTRERVGDVCLVKDVRHRTLLCDLIYRLSLRKGAFVPQFLVYQLLCPLGRGQIEKDARGSSGTMPKISQSHIKAWRVLLPPTNEQQTIVESIEIESRPIDTAIARTEREIALMQEYRTRLTADVVTGKLDVREAAAHLPAAAAEPAPDEPLEEIEPEETEA